MTTDPYAPTIETGDERTRSPCQIFRTPLGEPIRIELYEEVVIRRKDGKEYVLQPHAGTVPIPPLDPTDPATLAQTFPKRNPLNNEPTGGEYTYGEMFAMVHSFHQHWQRLRDDAVEISKTAQMSLADKE